MKIKELIKELVKLDDLDQKVKLRTVIAGELCYLEIKAVRNVCDAIYITGDDLEEEDDS